MRCSVCGCLLGCDADSGKIDKETGQIICDGCWTPELHPDWDEEEEPIPDDGVQELWQHPELDAYEYTDSTAKCTDIGGCE